MIMPDQVVERAWLIEATPELGMVSAAGSASIWAPRQHLRQIADEFDLCLIDTPGALSFSPPMTISALVAADAVVCPFCVGFYEARAISQLWAYLRRIKTQGYNRDLNLLGLVPSRVNVRSREEVGALRLIHDSFGESILPVALTERAAVKQSIMRRRPVWQGVRGETHRRAAAEWRRATAYILDALDEVVAGPSEARNATPERGSDFTAFHGNVNSRGD